MGDRDWVRLLQRHERLVRSSVAQYRGHVVKNQGDGFMLAFAEPRGDVAWTCVVRDAVAGQDGISVMAAEAVEFKGLTGTHEVYPVVLR